MTLTITDDSISGTSTRHTAEVVRREAGNGVWWVSWFPGRPLTTNQAITAMMIAQTIGDGLPFDDPHWPQIDTWAAELGITGPAASVRVAQAPKRCPDLIQDGHVRAGQPGSARNVG